MVTLELTMEQCDGILAALRMYQRALNHGDKIDREFIDIATNGGEHDGLSVDDIGDLCEEINSSAEVA